MKRCSSTSASERRPDGRRFLLRFFGIILAVFLLANVAATRAYLRYRYRPGSSEWGEKTRGLERQLRTGRPLHILFVGDSTVSCGVSPSQFDPDSYNLAWSGFEPSELAALARQILALPQRPQRVYIGITPGFLGQNEWRNTFDLPLTWVAVDAARNFYRDTNSMKPFVLMGGVCALGNRFLQPPSLAPAEPPAQAQAQAKGGEFGVEPDGLLVVEGSEQAQGFDTDAEIPFRPVNFHLLQEFKDTLGQAGIPVGWIWMPYVSGFEHILTTGPRASAGLARMSREIDRIFGGAVISLRGTVPDREFRDDAHLQRAGAVRLSRELGRRLAALPS
jgi:hypothetical protein